MTLRQFTIMIGACRPCPTEREKPEAPRVLAVHAIRLGAARPPGDNRLTTQRKASMRPLKIVGIVIGALLAVLVLGVVAVLVLVDPNDYRDDIEALVKSETGRSLQIGGEIDLKLFPWLALGVRDVRLGNPPGYGNEPFLTVREASVGVKLFPLLNKRLEVSRVAVDGLDVRLVSRGEDANNWKDLADSEDQKEDESGGDAPQASVAGIDVTGSTLVYTDEAEKSVSRLTNLEVHTGALGSGDPVDASMKFHYDDGQAPVARMEMKAVVQLASKLVVQNLEASGEWMQEKPDPPLPFSLKAQELSVDLDAETLAPATIEARFGELPVNITARGEKLFGAYVVSGNVAVENAAPRKVLPSLGVELPVTADPAALSSLSYKSDYRLTEKQLQLPALELVLDETQVRGSAAVEDLEAMALRFDLNVNAINLDRYLEPEPEEGEASKPAAEEPPTDLPLEALRELNARGNLRVGKATLSGLEFADIRLPLEAKSGRVHLGPTQARLFGGGYAGDIVLDARPAQARLTMNERVRGIDIGALMKATFETDRIVGRGDANAALTGTGNTDAAILKSLAGKLDFDVKEGAIAGIDVWYELRRAVALFKRTAPPAAPTGPPRTPFKALKGSATLDAGLMRNEDLVADMEYLKANGKGDIDLGKGTIDYRLVAQVYKVPSEGAGSEMADLKGEIPITITGPLAEMKIRPDVAGLAKARVKEEVDKKKEEVKEELKKKLGDKLKGLFGN
jgi:AsmA protein